MRGNETKAPDDLQTVDVRQAEALVGVPAKTWYRLVEDGQIPSYRIGRAVRLSVKDIREFLARCRREAS